MFALRSCGRNGQHRVTCATRTRGSAIPDIAEANTDLPAEIVGWIERESKLPVTRAIRVPGGNSREAWHIDLGDGADTLLAFLRYDRRAPDARAVFWSLQVEAQVFRALHGTGVTVPRILAVHPEQQAVLAERIEGDTWFYRIADPDEQVRTAQDFIRNLAALHRIDARTIDVPALGPVKSAKEHALDAVAMLRSHTEGSPQPIDPFVALSLDWLVANVPAYEGPAVLVQGDTGPGNFMYRDGRVTAVVDWELAHFGDPMDDIAWLSLRTVQDTFTHLPDRLAEYERLTGLAIDEPRVWYYRLMAEVRLAVVGVSARNLADEARTGRDAGNALIYGALHRRLLVEAFAGAAGVALDDGPVGAAADPDGPHADIHDAVLETMRTVIDRTSDPLALARAKSAVRLVRHLRAIDANGGRLATEEYAELTALVCAHTDAAPATCAAARTALTDAVRNGAVPVSAYITYLWHQIQRDAQLTRDSSGSLHRRTWPPLRDESNNLTNRGSNP